MKKSEFLESLEDILQREEPCLETDSLEDYIEWDSLSKMALMAYYDQKLKIKLNLSDFQSMKTVSDLVKLAGDNISD